MLLDVSVDSSLMWDAELVTRVRDRKLNEIMIFGSMAKIDSVNVDSYIDIIVSLGDDIDACDTLLDTDGEATIELDSIDRPAYLERLSESEMNDEVAFDAMKSEPSGETDEESMEDYVKGLISEAVESLKNESSSDALESMKEELRICRNRIEELSGQLDYAKGSESALQEQFDSMKVQMDDLEKANDELDTENRRLKIELKLVSEKLSVFESVTEEPSSPAEQIDDNQKETAAEEPVQEEAVEEKESAGTFISEQNLQSLSKIREMKDRKIDELIDAAASGKIDVEVGDDIIGFLKVDVAICDTLLSIDYSKKDSVISGFKKIVDILTESKEPVYQNECVGMLNEQEAFLEFTYSQILNSVQGMIMYLRDEILPKE